MSRWLGPAFAAMLIVLGAGTGAAQSPQLPSAPSGATDHLGAPRFGLGADGGGQAKTYIDPNRRMGLSSLSTDSPAFNQALAYNIQLWREKTGQADSCPDARPFVEGVHLYEMGVRGIVYFRFTSSAGANRRSLDNGPCAPGELNIVRLADGDWYVPTWGVRLVRP